MLLLIIQRASDGMDFLIQMDRVVEYIKRVMKLPKNNFLTVNTIKVK